MASRIAKQAANQVGLFIFDDVDVGDFSGIYQVFSAVERIRPESFSIFTFALRLQPVICTGGLTIMPQYTFGDLEMDTKMNILVVPGGEGRRMPVSNPMIQSKLGTVADKCDFILGVSTGTLILAAAGVLRQRQVTTHWLSLTELQRREDVIPYPGKIVQCGRVITCAGGALGVDVGLSVIRELYGQHLVTEVKSLIEYQQAETQLTKF